jgi:hypothetical protein
MGLKRLQGYFKLRIKAVKIFFLLEPLNTQK